MTKWMATGFLAAAPIIAWVAHSNGYDSGRDDAKAEYNAALIEQREAHAKALAEKQAEILDVERAWLEQDAEKEIVYRERVRTVVETVQDNADRVGFGQCRVDDDSLQQLNSALSGATEAGDTR